MVAGNNQQQSQGVDGGKNYRIRLYMPLLILSLGIALSIVAYFLVRNWEEAIIGAEFKIFADTRAAAIHREAIRHVDASTAMVGLFDASHDVDRSEFSHFAQEILGHHSDIKAVMWVPRVPAAEIEKWQRRAARDGLPHLRIHEPNRIGMAPLRRGQSDSFPVYYVQPQASNGGLLGADLMADTVYRGVLEAARDSGEVTPSVPVRLSPDQGSVYGLLLAKAVYRGGVIPATIAARRTALKGFILQLFSIPDFMRESLLEGDILGLDLSVYYETQPERRQLIFYSPSQSRADDKNIMAKLSNINNYATTLRWETSLDILGKSWRLVFTPAPKFWVTHPVWRSWAVMIVGMLMSILLGTYSFRLSRQSIRAERLALNLTHTNRNLEREIAERTRVEVQALKLSHAIEQSADAVMITDSNGVIEYVNSAFEKITGYSSAEAVGGKPSLVKSGQHDAEFYSLLWATIKRGEVFQDVFINRRKVGSLYYEETTITPLKDPAGNITHFISTGKDITERMQTQERLHYLAYNDLLTGLPNRLLFLERLGHAITSRSNLDNRLAVMCLDLDRFKIINDTLGHQVGDALLRNIAALLQSLVSEGETIARLGGDGFGILSEAVASVDGLADRARDILKAFIRPFHVEGHELYIAPSIGIGVYPEDGNDANTLLKNADIALHRSKEQGGGNYQYYSSDMSSKAFERLTLETSLRRALEQEEFLIFYQPQVDLLSGKVMGAEALLRWRHPELGLVSPLDFIPLLEETGLIVQVGEWILRHACEWAAGQSKYGDMRVSVNLSGRQFRVMDLADQVTRALNASRLKPQSLELEITESVLMQSDNASAANLTALDKMGIRLAIDDFGTGYSSLSYLKRFPIQTLKIDQSFIREVTENQDDAAIVTAIIAMAHSLKVEVVAEGVETRQQLDFLRDLGCDVVQGYYLSRPLPTAEINRFLGYGRQALDVVKFGVR